MLHFFVFYGEVLFVMLKSIERMKNEKRIRLFSLILSLLLAAGALAAVVFLYPAVPENPIDYNVSPFLIQDAEALQPQRDVPEEPTQAPSSTDPPETTTEEQDPTETTTRKQDPPETTTEEQDPTETTTRKQDFPETTTEKQDPTETTAEDASAPDNTAEESTQPPSEPVSDGSEPVNGTEPGEEPSAGGEPDDTEPTNEPGSEPAEDPGGDEEPVSGDGPTTAEAYLVTDLFTGTMERTALTDDVFSFYVYYSDRAVDADIRVNLNHKPAGAASYAGNGRFLSAQSDTYTTKLETGVNKFVVYYTNGAGERKTATYVITYTEKRADASTPTVGDAPPTVRTNLDGWTGSIRVSSFTFIVSIYTADGKPISRTGTYEGIEVFLDGKELKETTGTGGQYEYVLHFDRPTVGDSENHTVEIRTWDKDGNSRYTTYTVTYEAYDEGEVIGHVSMVIDATTVGLGVLDEFDYDIVQGKPAAATVLAMLEEFGYEPIYDGSVGVGFYLRGIRRSDTFRGAAIPDDLKECIVRDGIRFTSPCGPDALAEHDFTTGSGWLFAVNGTYPGKGLSDFYLNDGDTLYLRYTLAYGKDVGGFTLAGSGYGSLSSYCGMWVNDTYIQLKHDYQVTNVHEPTEDENGYTEYTCTRCGSSYREEQTP